MATRNTRSQYRAVRTNASRRQGGTLNLTKSTNSTPATRHQVAVRLRKSGFSAKDSAKIAYGREYDLAIQRGGTTPKQIADDASGFAAAGGPRYDFSRPSMFQRMANQDAAGYRRDSRNGWVNSETGRTSRSPEENNTQVGGSTGQTMDSNIRSQMRDFYRRQDRAARGLSAG